jgi:hypothetical protein
MQMQILFRVLRLLYKHVKIKIHGTMIVRVVLSGPSP